MREDPHILFLPVSSSTGIGEYFRSLCIANAIQKRWPRANLKFVLNRNAPYAQNAPFDGLLVAGSPTFHIKAINDFIRSEIPDLVIFDNAGRVAQLKCAREVGARTIFISARPNKRKKAFAWRWFSRLDQHWIANPAVDKQALDFYERIKTRANRNANVLFLTTVFPESDQRRRESFKEELGLQHDPYLLFVAGGGGWHTANKSSTEIFAEAAGRVALETGIRVVMVMGPLYQRKPPSLDGVITLPEVSNEHMIDLIHDAQLLALGGGGIIYQALALGRVCVAAAAGGGDQKKRIEQLAQHGLIEAAGPTSASISQAVLRLLNDRERLQAIQSKVKESGISNGLYLAIEAVQRLLDGSTPKNRSRGK